MHSTLTPQKTLRGNFLRIALLIPGERSEKKAAKNF